MKKISNNTLVSFVIGCFCLFSSSVFADAPTYKFVDLGLQESDQSEAIAVNDNGQVAGAYWLFGKKHYFLWNEQAGISLIDLPETATEMVLNNLGQIAGNYKDTAGNDHGFFWDPCCGICDIGSLGGSYTHVYDMNDHGQIVGESESKNLSLVDGQKEVHAFLWQCGCMIDLGALTGDLGFQGDRSKATGINKVGQIIGISNYLIAHKRKFLRINDRCVVWQNGVVEEIDSDSNLETEHSAQALSINNNGIAIYKNNKLGNFAVFLSNKSIAKIQDVGHLTCKFIKINDKGDIFTYHENSREASQYAYFNMSGDFNAEDYLRSYKGAGFYNSFEHPEQWKPRSFSGAYAFNNKRWLVGIVQNIYGERHGVLLVPVLEQTQQVQNVE